MRKLGQHFLKDDRVLEKITSVLQISSTDTVVEIGPGHGELTKYVLLNLPKKVFAIEKDEGLADKLAENFPELDVIKGDALEILPTLHTTHRLLPTASWKLAGNIPYYITGKLLRTIGEMKNKPALIVLTVQKEVAERLSADPPKMNLLAASVKFWGEPQIVRNISKHAFRPKPKVESSIIRIVPHKQQEGSAEQDKYYKFIKALFKQPRKTILNNLSDGLNLPRDEAERILKSQGVEPKLRPQNLDIDTINNLSQSF